MDERTIQIYEASAGTWAARRPSKRRAEAHDLADAMAPDAVRVDLGCGPGGVTPDLGTPVVALDAAFAMLTLARDAAPAAFCVQADLEDLPFRPRSIGGMWARNSYLHVPQRRLPLALAQLHRASVPGAPFALAMKPGNYEGHALPGDDFPGRFFALWEPERLAEVVQGAGFEVTACDVRDTWIHIHGTRARTLPDFVGPGMRILVCGLNPSLHAADAGVGFAGPSNRLWPAALDAGLVTRQRDPWHALRADRVGMTDLVKRASVDAREVRAREYRAGAARVERLVDWLEPEVVCFVGLAGYRAAVNRRAQPGAQMQPFGGAPAYVMPSTSGLNTRTSRAELTEHLRAAIGLAR